MTDRVSRGAAFARPSLFPLKPHIAPLARWVRALLLVAWRMHLARRARKTMRLDIRRLSEAQLRDIGLEHNRNGS